MARMRPTVTEAQFKRHMKRGERRNKVATRTAAHNAHRAERHTIASHLHTLGVDAATATGMAATLRKKVTGRGIRGFAPRSLTDTIRRACTRYTLGQVMAALAAYKPRKAEFKAGRRHAITRLLALAA